MNNAFRFKVGDRVRVTEKLRMDKDWISVGDEYEITFVDTGHPYRVELGDESDWLRESQLELVSTVYKLQVPPEPEGVTRVRSVGRPDHVYLRREDGEWSTPTGVMRFTWDQLVRGLTQGVEPVPDPEHEYRVSLDYLRRNPHVLDGLAEYSVTGSHAAAIVRHVLEEE